jgi:hypothetical protein
MSLRRGWSLAAVLFAAAGTFSGCGEDISPGDLSKLSETEKKPKEEPPPPQGDPFAAPPPEQNTDQPSEDPFAAPPAPPPAGQSGYGATGSGPPPSAQSGYGATGQSNAAVADNTYGHGAPILLKSEVSQADVFVANGKIGRKGQGYGGGIITEPLSQYFQIQTRIEFLNLKNWLKNFWALNNNRSPPTVAEFDQKILKEAGVSLPELSPGQFYVYDPGAKDLDLVLTVGQNKPM